MALYHTPTVVAAHAGRVGVGTTPGGGATFRVELPLAPATPEIEDDAEDDAGDSDTELGETAPRTDSTIATN